MTNNLPFDPIRPSATARGFVIISLSNSGAVIGTDTISGASAALPPNSRADRTITLRAGTVLNGAIDV